MREVFENKKYKSCFFEKNNHSYKFIPKETRSYKFSFLTSSPLKIRIFSKKELDSFDVNQECLDFAKTFIKGKKYLIEVISSETIDYDFFIQSVPFKRTKFSESQWYIQNMINGIDINIIPAWEYIRNAKAKIGVVDSGIYEIESLSSNLNHELFYDFPNEEKLVEADSCSFWCNHGTYIASIISASSNNLGFYGLINSSNIISLRIFADSKSSNNLKKSEYFVQAIKYAQGNGIKILSCSFGGVNFVKKEYQAIKQAKEILFVVSAGNDSLNLDIVHKYPACYNLDNIIVVGAVNKYGELYNTSNYGSYVDILAPGEEVFGIINNDKLIRANGTSSAVPFVASLAALLLEASGQLEPKEIIEYICKHSTLLPNLSGKIRNPAIINFYKCIKHFKIKK